MKRITIISILTLLAAWGSPVFAQATSTSDFIGYRYESPEIGTKLPNGFIHRGGGLFGDINAERVYGVSTLEKGKTLMFWLEISLSRDRSGGVTAWEVKDALSFSEFRQGDRVLEFNDPSFECLRGGKVLADLVGIGRFDKKRGTFTPRKLWRPNAGTARFEPVTTRNVRCIYSEP